MPATIHTHKTCAQRDTKQEQCTHAEHEQMWHARRAHIIDNSARDHRHPPTRRWCFLFPTPHKMNKNDKAFVVEDARVSSIQPKKVDKPHTTRHVLE